MFPFLLKYKHRLGKVGGIVMNEEVFIEFYRGKDEQAFLEAWKTTYGSLSEEEIDELYTDIAEEIDKQVKTEEHELGEIFVYQDIPVGKSDYNGFYNLYLFEQE